MKQQRISVPLRLSHRAPLYFLFFSVVCQIIAMACAYLAGRLWPHPFFMMALHSLTAFFLARWLKLSLPWQIFNLLLVPAVVLYSALALPNWLAFAAMLSALLMYLPTFWTRVPYFPTSTKLYDVIAGKLPLDKDFSFIDLGCGFAGLLAHLARTRPQGKFYGVEISPLPFLISKLRFLFSKQPSVKIELKNFWSLPLKSYDFVYAFLAPGPMPFLWDKVKSEMKPGAFFITNTFKVEAKAAQEIEIDDPRQTKLYIHRM